jgi:predicted DNA-binding WGR domain protein
MSLADKVGPGVVRLVLLECVQDGSSKAYVVVVERDAEVPGAYRCHAAWGKIGGPSQSQIKQSGSLGICERRLDELVREKQKRGYKVVKDERPDGTGEGSKVPAAAAPPADQPATSEERLEDLLARRRREAAWSI